MEEIEIGSMVICNGRTARVANFRDDIAHCIHINQYGDIVDLEAPVENLKPLWLEYSPQSGWPEINQIDDSMLAPKSRRRAAA